MKDAFEPTWQTHEFADEIKVTVRTLHHYDRIGLLKPTRTANGFRRYGIREFVRMQQINTLKFIGLPLAQIKQLLDQRVFDLRGTFELQRLALIEQRERIDRALRAIERAEEKFGETGSADLESFREIIEVMNMEQNMDWTKKYYSEAAAAKVEERKALWSPELQERATRDWQQLAADAEAAIADGVDPTDERAQGLVERWNGLINEFTGGDPGIRKGLDKMYADQENWPKVEWEKPYSKEVEEFIGKAMKAK